jgi:tankyrase
VSSILEQLKKAAHKCALYWLVSLILNATYLISLIYNFFFVASLSLSKLSHGIDPTIKNQDGQTALDLSGADDVRALLEAAMPELKRISPAKSRSSKRDDLPSGAREKQSAIAGSTAASEQPLWSSASQPSTSSASTEAKPAPVMPLLCSFSSTETEVGDGCVDLDNELARTQLLRAANAISVGELLRRIDADYERAYGKLLTDEHITLDILAGMSHEQLREVGVKPYGARHKILQAAVQHFNQC